MSARFFSPLGNDVLKAIFLVCLADGLVGISYGSLAVAGGFPLWVPLMLSLLVLAGASEFLFIAIVGGVAARLRRRRPDCWSMRAIYRSGLR